MTTINIATFHSWLDELMGDMTPREREIFDAEMREIDEALQVPCAWGFCINEVSRTTGKILGGVGPLACPHDLLPGWRAKYPAGAAKPGVPVKARGRHGSRRQRSIARRRYLREFAAEHPDLVLVSSSLYR